MQAATVVIALGACAAHSIAALAIAVISSTVNASEKLSAEANGSRQPVRLQLATTGRPWWLSRVTLVDLGWFPTIFLVILVSFFFKPVHHMSWVEAVRTWQTYRIKNNFWNIHLILNAKGFFFLTWTTSMVAVVNELISWSQQMVLAAASACTLAPCDTMGNHSYICIAESDLLCVSPKWN